MSLIPHELHKEFELFRERSYLLTESIRGNHFGIRSLEEKYADVVPTQSEIENTLRYVVSMSNPTMDEITLLGSLSAQCSNVGITFDMCNNSNKAINYPRTGIVYGETDNRTGVVYIYVNDTFIDLLKLGHNLTDNMYKQMSKDIYDQLVHEMTHKHQVVSANKEIEQEPIGWHEALKHKPDNEPEDTFLKYLLDIHEIDAFARQLAFELSDSVDYDTAIKWLETNNDNLNTYKPYAIYKSRIYDVIEFSKQQVKKDPTKEQEYFLRPCQKAWRRFKWRVMCFLLSMYENHFRGPNYDIDIAERLPK